MLKEEPVKNPADEEGSENVILEDIEALKKALSEEKAKVETNLAGWQRTQADHMNYKQQSEQDKGEAIKYANGVLMLNLLHILDDLELAFASIPQRLAKNNWVEGVRLIERKLQIALEAQGLSPVKALGEPFDPRLHEAIRQDTGEEGMVIEEAQKGYTFRDKVIRPSKVVVGNGKEN